MSLPDICKQKGSVLSRYLSLIYYMATIDGNLDPQEKSLLEQMCHRFGFIEKRNFVMESKVYSDTKIKEEFLILKENNLHYSFFLDMLAMALADGCLMDKEKILLAQIAELLDLENEDFYNLINFSQATANLDLNAGVDPMFAYVIDSFFQWVQVNNVALYQQTTLAIDNSVDQYLKARL